MTQQLQKFHRLFFFLEGFNNDKNNQNNNKYLQRWKNVMVGDQTDSGLLHKLKLVINA